MKEGERKAAMRTAVSSRLVLLGPMGGSIISNFGGKRTRILTLF